MRKTILSVVALVAGLLAMPSLTVADEAAIIKEGKQLTFNRKKGNCLSCHAIEDGVTPGNIGPPLLNMKQRFKSQDDLRAQIWDATKRNPETHMPPFGRHNILSNSEIDKIAVYIWSL